MRGSARRGTARRLLRRLPGCPCHPQRGPSPRYAGLAALLLVAACGPADPSGTEADAAAPGSENDALSWRIPGDVPPEASEQADFEDFAWRTFIALSWPAGPGGGPDTTAVIGAGGDAPTVWEQYSETGAVFRPGAAEPEPWGEGQPIPPACRAGGAGAGERVVRMIHKADVLTDFVQPQTAPVVDQSGGWARYGVSLNRVVYDYVVDNGLYDRSVQEGFGVVDFPVGTYGGPPGAMTLKSAWKVLDGSEDAGRFHTRTAWVYTPAAGDRPAECASETLGLVGFHVGHKTESHPQWIWATFEQVDNLVPPPGGSVASFRDPGCDSCRANQPPPPPWDPTEPGPPTQVERVIPIPRETAERNAAWQSRLASAGEDSPWPHYELVGVQRARTPSDTVGIGAPTPTFLANALLETYLQGEVPNVSSSCAQCHHEAATWSGAFGDYVYAFVHAQSPEGP